jgi:RHS repeat-associated protein
MPGAWREARQAWLPEAGLYYYKARMYQPGLGRFLQPDPIGYGGGANLYAYVGNDPINFVDPLGLQTLAPGQTWCGPGCVETADGLVVTVSRGIIGSAFGGGLGAGAMGTGRSHIRRLNLTSGGGGRTHRSPREEPQAAEGRQCSAFKRGAENVADFFANAGSAATDLALASGGGAVAVATIGNAPAAGFLTLASGHFAAQAAAYGSISAGASWLSGNKPSVILNQLTSFGLKKIAPFASGSMRDKIADQANLQGSRCAR